MVWYFMTDFTAAVAFRGNKTYKPRDVTVREVAVVVVDSHIQRIVLATEETTVTQQVSHRPIKRQSRLWSQRGTKVNGSHHGDNPLLRPTGIQIATKSYAALQAMAPTNIKTVHQTSLLHSRATSIDSECCRLPTTSVLSKKYRLCNRDEASTRRFLPCKVEVQYYSRRFFFNHFASSASLRTHTPPPLPVEDRGERRKRRMRSKFRALAPSRLSGSRGMRGGGRCSRSVGADAPNKLCTVHGRTDGDASTSLRSTNNINTVVALEC